MKYGKPLIQRLEDVIGASIIALDKEEGDYSITVKPLSVQFVTSLLDSEIGTRNYEMKYNAEYVTWTIDFNITGKRRQVAK